jgi:prefoldin subunit 5
VSKPALERARSETRHALQKSLDAMDRSIESLKQELKHLQDEEAAGGA